MRFVDGSRRRAAASTRTDRARGGSRAARRHAIGRRRRRYAGRHRLKDIVKTHIKERFAELRKMGIRTIMITGDNKLTAASIAAEAGVDISSRK
jgi:K+-transporting ATPase ATPase B chain